jgi:beta-lactam-binding protein with PASTA domain
MVTPTAVGKFSGLGITVVLYDVHSSTISPGHIASTSPIAGTTVYRDQPVVVDLSVAKSIPVGYD